MKKYIALLIMLAAFIVVILHIKEKYHMSQSKAESPLHVQNKFEFDIDAPLKTAAPLFGPEGERAWGGDDWNPKFLHPQPARDIPGAVFTVPHGHTQSVWVNTLFDLNAGRMQYVYFVPDYLVTLIDVQLSSTSSDQTHVKVSYERTALKGEANDHVQKLATHDAVAGPEWRKSIAEYLKKQR